MIEFEAFSIVQTARPDPVSVQIPRLCAGNSRLVFALSCAFAAPLLRLLNEPGGGFNLFGNSSDGKSTALYVAASVYGNPETYPRKWNSTHVGLEYLAFSRNDGLLALDELGEGEGRYAGKVAYTLADGVGKNRGKASGGMKETPAWKVITLSTGETTLEQHINESGVTVRAGQQVRMVDLPADTGSGYRALECLHGLEWEGEGGLRPKDQAGGLFADHLNDLTKRHYGTPLIPFLEYVSENYSRDPSAFHLHHKEYVNAFISRCLPGEASPQVRRVARRFALVAFAGELASLSGVTGWESGGVIGAVHTCFQAWIDQRGGTGAQEEKAALDQVKYFFERYSESRFIWIGEGVAQSHKPNEMAGYKKKIGGEVQYMVMPGVFKHDICEGLNAQKVISYCVEAGILTSDKHGKSAQNVRISSTETRRLYVFSQAAMGQLGY